MGFGKASPLGELLSQFGRFETPWFPQMGGWVPGLEKFGATFLVFQKRNPKEPIQSTKEEADEGLLGVLSALYAPTGSNHPRVRLGEGILTGDLRLW